MPISKEIRDYIQELIDIGVVNISAVNTLPPGINSASQLIRALAPNIDQAKYMAYALEQSNNFYYIPGLALNVEFIKHNLKSDTIKLLCEVHQVLPLNKIGNTIWCAVFRVYPFEKGKIEEILNSSIGCNIPTPREYSTYMDQLAQLGYI